ncbi:hypothetical protein HK100_000783 [Physocladia obscura]|uniref:PARP-type domain-containing protein n=1 Tax=Physocladia obscura TaxID=109957 RepID=A0AAD5SY42_9FUNG|nr:hypothetical protein HK100_000783 [Physocladia obscura]
MADSQQPTNAIQTPLQDNSSNAEPGTQYTIEHALSGRSKCKKCKETIQKGEPRYGTSKEGVNHGSIFWKHIHCVTKAQIQNCEEDLGTTLQISGLDKFSAAEQKHILDTLDTIKNAASETLKTPTKASVKTAKKSTGGASSSGSSNTTKRKSKASIGTGESNEREVEKQKQGKKHKKTDSSNDVTEPENANQHENMPSVKMTQDIAKVPVVTGTELVEDIAKVPVAESEEVGKIEEMVDAQVGKIDTSLKEKEVSIGEVKTVGEESETFSNLE